MTVINHKSISGITSITAPAGSDDLLTVHTNDTTERFRIVDSGAIVTGVTTASNFKTGTTNVHNVGVEEQVIKPGTKVAQGVFINISYPLLTEVEEDNVYGHSTDRGDGALGSTGDF